MKNIIKKLSSYLQLATAPTKRGNIAICVGHSRLVKNRHEGGALSVDGTNEWYYNNVLADMIAEHLEAKNFNAKVIKTYDGGGYATAMAWLAGLLKTWKADAAVELHFNAAGVTANGHEWLYWHTSKEGMALACKIEERFLGKVPSIKRRGIKPIKSSERGGTFLRKMPCPAVIAEPFFGTNKKDWVAAKTQSLEIADAIAQGISDWWYSKLVQIPTESESK